MSSKECASITNSIDSNSLQVNISSTKQKNVKSGAKQTSSKNEIDVKTIKTSRSKKELKVPKIKNDDNYTYINGIKIDKCNGKCQGVNREAEQCGQNKISGNKYCTYHNHWNQ